MLSADALAKLQQLADWMERELQEGQQDPRVKLSNFGTVSTFTNEKVTRVTPFGALAQMFDPFKLSDSTTLTFGVQVIQPLQLDDRVAKILGLSIQEVVELRRQLLSNGYTLNHVLDALRKLK